nr:MAG TPA: hypothetical protein [Caudoviricetes sp.]
MEKNRTRLKSTRLHYRSKMSNSLLLQRYTHALNPAKIDRVH